MIDICEVDKPMNFSETKEDPIESDRDITLADGVIDRVRSVT